MQSIRIYEMPTCKMVLLGTGTFGEEKFNLFEKWFSSQKRSLFPKDFLYWDGDSFVWLYMFEDGMLVSAEFEITNFQGGLYDVATDIGQKTDKETINAEVDKFLSENGFERDPARPELGNAITPPTVQKIMGSVPMGYYTPIEAKK